MKGNQPADTGASDGAATSAASPPASPAASIASVSGPAASTASSPVSSIGSAGSAGCGPRPAEPLDDAGVNIQREQVGRTDADADASAAREALGTDRTKHEGDVVGADEAILHHRRAQFVEIHLFQVFQGP